MVKHVILWKIKDELSEAEKTSVRNNAKAELEGLLGQIDGLLTVRVETRRLPSSNADLMLYTEFDSNESLLAYQKNRLHNAVADTYILPFMCQRLCLDYPDVE